MQTSVLKDVVHLLLANGQEKLTEQLPSLPQYALTTLESHSITTFDFDGLPSYPVDCIEGQTLRPFIDLGRQIFDDIEGHHSFWLRRLKTSLVSVFAGVPEQEMEAFCRRWSQHWIYSLFQGWQHVSPEVAQETCRDMAFRRLHPFLCFFRPLCAEALTTSKSIYFLEERHDKELA